MELTEWEKEIIEQLICRVAVCRLYDEGYIDIIPPQYREEA